MNATSAVKKAMPLSKSAALECAQRHLSPQTFKDARIREGRFNANGSVVDDPAWFIYPILQGPGKVTPPSLVLVVCQRTGQVLYSGPGHNAAA
jgi:hypothetical protein